MSLGQHANDLHKSCTLSDSWTALDAQPAALMEPYRWAAQLSRLRDLEAEWNVFVAVCSGPMQLGGLDSLLTKGCAAVHRLPGKFFSRGVVQLLASCTVQKQVPLLQNRPVPEPR